MQNLKGIIPILPATFTADGLHIDEEGLRGVIDVVIEEGVHGLGIFGVGTEFYKLTDSERKRMLDVTVEQCNKRVPVIVSVTSHATQLAVKEAKDAEEAGADALNIFPPYFMSPSGEMIVNHISSIAKEVDLPLIIQYAPHVTGLSIGVETFLEITKQRSAPIYIKVETTPPGPLTSQLIKESDGQIGVFIGNLGLHSFDAFERGASGLMPGCSRTKVYVDLYNEYFYGSKQKAFELYNKLVPLITVSGGGSGESFLAIEKMNLVRRGIIKSDYCRSPNYTLDSQYKNLLERYHEYELENFGSTIR